MEHPFRSLPSHGAPGPSPTTPATHEATDPHAATPQPPSKDQPTPPVKRGIIKRRTAVLDEVAESLRAMLGLDPDEPAPGERAADLGRPLPLVIQGLDAGAWIAWCLTGLRLFSDHGPGRLPSLRLIKASAGRMGVTLAMLRSGGNISKASAMVKASRKVLRANLRSGELYPWPKGTCDAHGRVGR